MKGGLYSRMALSNLGKNHRFYLPRILTCAGLLSVFYIVWTLTFDGDKNDTMRGGSYVSSFMSIGIYVHAIISVILVLYTNSFIMKQRKREFGLYNILGMEKRHVCRVLFFETLYQSLCSDVVGIGFGILMYKFCSLIVCRILKIDVIHGFNYIVPKAILISVLFFSALELLTYIINCIRIAMLRPVELLASRSAGEKEPSLRVLLLILGILSLAAGYAIALATRDPLDATVLFFLAVILVIIGTYFLFVAGSIWVLRMLRRNRRFYYNKRHMTAVSGLIYRMKQNAVGLASIAVLATGVIILVSTTVSLYSGIETTLERNYPEDLYLGPVSYNYGLYDPDTRKNLSAEELAEIVEDVVSENGGSIEKIQLRHELEIPCDTADDSFVPILSGENTVYVIFISQDKYCELTGMPLELGDGEIAVTQLCDLGDVSPLGDTLGIAGKRYTIVQRPDKMPIRTSVVTRNCYGIVMHTDKELEEVKNYYSTDSREYKWTDKVAVSLSEENPVDYDILLTERIPEIMREKYGDSVSVGFSQSSIYSARDDMYGMYGVLLFLGLLLGVVFLFATVLIIYYKQISEGYEDHDRYQIMEKIGMSRSEVRASIRTQVLLVFFLPLAVAGIHTVVASPILLKILRVMLLPRVSLYIICAAAVYFCFSLIYLIVYLLTARTYYKIVA